MRTFSVLVTYYRFSRDIAMFYTFGAISNFLTVDDKHLSSRFPVFTLTLWSAQSE